MDKSPLAKTLQAVEKAALNQGADVRDFMPPERCKA